MAINSIYKLLTEKYPSNRYASKISIDKLKKDLLNSIKTKDPFVVTFTPKIVKKSGGRWSCRSTFIELAGVSLIIDDMYPRISRPDGRQFVFKNVTDKKYGGLSGRTIHLKAFGKISDNWSCINAIEGSSVTLNYIGHKKGGKGFWIRSYTKLG